MKFTTKLFLILLQISFIASASTSNDKVTEYKPPLTLSQEESWGLMIGKWFGSQPIKDGGRRDWIVTRLPNGVYEIVFRIYDDNGSNQEYIEVGEWGVAGPVYFSIFKGRVKDGKIEPVDPMDPYNRDAYKIISLTDKEFTYESFSSGNRYTLKRVENSFTLPDE